MSVASQEQTPTHCRKVMTVHDKEFRPHDSLWDYELRCVKCGHRLHLIGHTELNEEYWDIGDTKPIGIGPPD